MVLMLLGWIGTLGRRITWHASPAIRSLMWGCVIQDSYLRIGNAQIIKLWKQVVYIVPFWSGSLVFYRWIKINNVKRAQHSPRSAQLLLSYLWFIFFSSSFSLGICILILYTKLDVLHIISLLILTFPYATKNIENSPQPLLFRIH